MPWGWCYTRYVAYWLIEVVLIPLVESTELGLASGSGSDASTATPCPYYPCSCYPSPLTGPELNVPRLMAMLRAGMVLAFSYCSGNGMESLKKSNTHIFLMWRELRSQVG